MSHTRRTILSFFGAALPFGICHNGRATPRAAPAPPALGFRSFEAGVRAAFANDASPAATRRVELGCSEQVFSGIQGCHNDRPFAGFETGRLRIVRVGTGPGSMLGGVRLFVTTVDVAVVGHRDLTRSSRPLDFSSLPPAVVFV